MTKILIDDDVHKALTLFKVDKHYPSLSEAIRALLINADYMKVYPASMNPALQQEFSHKDSTRTPPPFAGMRPAGTPPNTKRNE